MMMHKKLPNEQPGDEGEEMSVHSTYRSARPAGDKVVPLLAAKRVEVIEGPDAQRLGRAVGRETTAAVGVLDRNLARGIRDLLATSSLGWPAGAPPAGT